MIIFLTSSPSGPLDKPNDEKVLDETNGFVEQLRQVWKRGEVMRGLIIAASPEAYEENDEMGQFFEQAFRNSGVPVCGFDILDERWSEVNREDLNAYDVIMLGGGHVPTQNQFFHRIGLREKLEGYEGIVLGVSAGTMNSADVVYAQPELEGESINPEYERYLSGLGLTDVMVLPHYQMVKEFWLDGKRLFEDITYGDSFGKEFIALEDGSYIRIMNGETFVYGRAYRISNGALSVLCEDGHSIPLEKNAFANK